MIRITDPGVARAITLMYEAAVERRNEIQRQLDLADKHLTVASRLHDLMLNARDERPLRSAS